MDGWVERLQAVVDGIATSVAVVRCGGKELQVSACNERFLRMAEGGRARPRRLPFALDDLIPSYARRELDQKISESLESLVAQEIEQAFDLIFNLGDAIDTFVGWDTIVLPAFSAGAAGSIWGAPNFAPKECVAIFELAKEGKTAEALEIFKRLWNVFDFMGKEGYAVSTKAVAQAVGVDLGKPRAPYGELEPEKLDELRKLVAETGLNYA